MTSLFQTGVSTIDIIEGPPLDELVFSMQKWHGDNARPVDFYTEDKDIQRVHAVIRMLENINGDQWQIGGNLRSWRKNHRHISDYSSEAQEAIKGTFDVRFDFLIGSYSIKNRTGGIQFRNWQLEKFRKLASLDGSRLG